MNNVLKSFMTIAISVIASFFLVTHVHAPMQSRQSVYERVISSGVLHCGYFPEAPFTMIDPNTGKKSGIAVELAEKVAAELGVKVEWVSAENFGALTEDLRNGRYDAICASTYNMPRAGHIDYTMPYAYAPVFAYTKKGRIEFDNKLDQLDWSKVTIAGIDGEGATTIARKKVPEAKFAILPESTPVADMLGGVSDGKADMALVAPGVFKLFDKNNSGALQKIAGDKPFHVFNVSFGLKPDEAGLKNVLDFLIRNMIANGQLDALFRKYDPDGFLLHPAMPYREADNGRS